MSQPTFFGEGSTPRVKDTLWRIEQKILGALLDGGSGGGGSGSGSNDLVVDNLAARPAAPPDPTKSGQIAYRDATPSQTWDPLNLIWFTVTFLITLIFGGTIKAATLTPGSLDPSTFVTNQPAPAIVNLVPSLRTNYWTFDLPSGLLQPSVIATTLQNTNVMDGTNGPIIATWSILQDATNNAASRMGVNWDDPDQGTQGSATVYARDDESGISTYSQVSATLHRQSNATLFSDNSEPYAGLFANSQDADTGRTDNVSLQTDLNAIDTGTGLIIGVSSTTRVQLLPDVADGTTPHFLDTSLAHSSGSLFTVDNFGTNKFSVSWDGAITTANPSGGTESPMKIGLNGSVPRLDLNGTGYDLATSANAANWAASGTTNSILSGFATVDHLVITNFAVSTVGLAINATNGQSGNLIDAKVNGTSKFNVSSGGSLAFGTAATISASGVFSPAGALGGAAYANTGVFLANDRPVFWSSTSTWGGTSDLSLYRNGGGTALDIRSGTSPMEVDLYDRYVTDTDNDRAIFSYKTNAHALTIMTTYGTNAPTGGRLILGVLNTNALTIELNQTLTVAQNIGATLSVGNTGYVDVTKASQTNAVSGTLTLVYATNGVDLVDYTAVRWLFNGSGSDQTLAIPSGWRTNVYSAVPPKLTNSTITKMILSCNGPTSSAALQTNCYVSFEYFK